jgi:hypothetical protein
MAAKKPKKKDKNQGLVTMCFWVPLDLYKRFKIKTIRERITIRAAAVALLTAYVEGEIKFEEEKHTG